MKIRLLALALSTAFALPAAAADAPGAPEMHFEKHIIVNGADMLADAADARGMAESWRAWADEFARDMESAFSYQFSDRVGRGKVVKGAPYSAEVITESNQKLADGNMITHKKMSRVYRDGEGRTRQESYRDDKVRSIYISDPLARANYTLLPDSKIAVTTPLGRQ